jgi:V/A-type H+-transporting ATPase subunit F
MEEKKKKEIAVIGDEEFTLGFKLAGVTKIFNPDDYQQKIRGLVEREDIGILVAEENDLDQLPKRIRNQVESSVEPVVVSLSETAESERLQDKIKKAIGADIT